MSITDELREWLNEYGCEYGSEKFIAGSFGSIGQDKLVAIADRIDAEHESKVSYWQGASYKDGYDEGFASADDWLAQHEDAMAEHGWVKLPLDADGEPIRVGDVVIAQLLFGGESKPLVVDRMELSRGRDGDLWCVALDNDKECWNQPSILRHHRPPTVEGILRDFGVDIAHALDADPDATVPEAIIAEYAAKLRLAGEDE